MKNTVKQNEIAASAQQMLPDLPSARLHPVRAAAQPFGRDRLVDFDWSETLVTSANTRGVLAPLEVDLPSVRDPLTGRISPMGRMVEVVTREVWMFKQTASDTVEVVLTPDQHTQISLRLHWRDGIMEAQARCEQGDFLAFRAQWPVLQEALAQQGVRLSSLTQETQANSTGWFGFSSFGQSPRGGHSHGDYSPAEHDAPPVMVPQKPGVAPSHTRGRARRLLESWA